MSKKKERKVSKAHPRKSGKALTYEKNDSGVLIIDSKDEHNKGGFKMLFTGTEGKPAQFVLTDEIAKAHKTTVAKLKEQIESSPLFGNTFWAA